MLAADGPGAHRGRLLARERDRRARLAGDEDPASRLRRFSRVGHLDARKVAVAAMRGLARDAEGAGDRAEGLPRIQGACDLQALEGIELLAQGRHRPQRRRRLGGADGVLDEIAEPVG